MTDVAIPLLAKHPGERAALVDGEGAAVRYSQLASSIESFAGQLADAGLGREDRVGLLVPPGVSGAHLVVALAANITVVPLNPALTGDEFRQAASTYRLAAIVIPDALDASVRSTLTARDITLIESTVTPQGTPALKSGRPARTPRPRMRAARESDVALMLRSSGTTGAPKLIPVTHGNLHAMAQKMRSERWFGLTSEDRVVCTLPLYYAAGLKTSLLVPLILGQSIAFPPPGRALDIAHWIEFLKPTYLSVAPTPLNAMLDRLKSARQAFRPGPLRFVMCAAAYLPDELRLEAESLLGVPLVEYYALSEAGVMAANPAPPGRIKPGTVGLPAPGELLLVDEQRRPVANGAIGEIMISGPSLTPGYVVTGGAAPDESLKHGWLLTGDLGRIDADGYLSIVGRTKEVINRGGEKVFPYEVEKTLLQHPAVLEAAVFAVPHPRLGENVAAAAVLRPGSAVSEAELRAFLAGRLARFKLPRRVCFVESLPRGKTGKVMRNALSEAYSASRGKAVEPHHPLEIELHALWKRLLRTADVGIDDDFLDKGGDSLLATEMLLEVERLTGQPYPQSELSTLTIRRIAEVVASSMPASRSLVTQVKRGTGVPLFFCHGDFLTRGIYAHQLAALLPENQPVFLLHCPAEGSPASSVESIARAYVDEVLHAAEGSPVVLGGFCNGGLAAWHLAYLLRTHGVNVLDLLLVETMSLNARLDLRPLARLFAAAARVVPGRAGTFLRDDVMRALWSRRRGLEGLAALLYRIARRNIFPATRPQRDAGHVATQRYLKLMSRYVPPPLDVDVTCFVAERGERFDTDPHYWRGLARSVSEIEIPGTHLEAIIGERPALARALGEALQRASARFSAGGPSVHSPGMSARPPGSMHGSIGSS